MKTVKLFFVFLFILQVMNDVVTKGKIPNRKLLLESFANDPTITPEMIQLLQRIKPLLNDPEKKSNFLKALSVVKSTKNSRKRQRKLSLLGMDFLNEYIPMLEDEKFSMVLNGFLIVYLNQMLHKSNDNEKINKLNKRIDDAENSLMMTRTQKDRDLNYVKKEMAELKDEIEGMEESSNSMINALNNWITGVMRRRLI